MHLDLSKYFRTLTLLGIQVTLTSQHASRTQYCCGLHVDFCGSLLLSNFGLVHTLPEA